ncbi:MAG: hypothetical protein ACKO3N_15695, partial [Verrucomicrobiota bacterium]
MNILGIFNRAATLGALLALGGATSFAATGSAKVAGLRGTAQAGVNNLKPGDDVATATPIKTGDKSTLDLNLGANGPTVQLQGSSTLTLDELALDESGPETVVTTKMTLAAGKVAGYVKKTSASSTYSVSTATSTFSVRGPATYQVSADGFVWVWDGCVDVAAREAGGTVRNYKVCSGQMLDPNIPGVVQNEYPSGPVFAAPSGREPVIPFGPIANRTPVRLVDLSPIKTGSSTPAPRGEE